MSTLENPSIITASARRHAPHSGALGHHGAQVHQGPVAAHDQLLVAFGKVLEHWYGPSLEGTRPALVAERRNYYNRYISVYFDLCKPVSHFQKTVSTRVWVRL